VLRCPSGVNGVLFRVIGLLGQCYPQRALPVQPGCCSTRSASAAPPLCPFPITPRSLPHIRGSRTPLARIHNERDAALSISTAGVEGGAGSGGGGVEGHSAGGCCEGAITDVRPATWESLRFRAE
jgi:hypothetical protein